MKEVVGFGNSIFLHYKLIKNWDNVGGKSKMNVNLLYMFKTEVMLTCVAVD